MSGYALMRVFLAGAGGAIGRRLTPLLLRAGHEVTGTTRSADKTKELERGGVAPAVVDVFDAPAVSAAMPLDLSDPTRAVTIKGAADMEQQVLASGLDAVILRYGFFYGPGTWHEEPTRKPGLHIDAAAQAALLALTRGAGIYNIADEDGVVSIAKARAELGFDPQVRLP